MARFHTTENGDVPFTQAEEDAADAREAIELAAKPLHDWEMQMSQIDAKEIAGLARTIEDLLDANPSILNSKPQAYKDNHAARKILRAQRPV